MQLCAYMHIDNVETIINVINFLIAVMCWLVTANIRQKRNTAKQNSLFLFNKLFKCSRIRFESHVDVSFVE